MFSSRFTGSVKFLVLGAVAISIAGFALFLGASSPTAEAQSKSIGARESIVADFPGANLGGIPDGPAGTCQPTQGTPRNVTFDVAGIAGAPTNVEISTTFGSPAHSFSGDITATLIAPNGASHSIFGRLLATTATGFGDSSDLVGPYSFADNHAAPPSGGFWQAATAAAAAVGIASGDYRTTNSGGAGAVNPVPPTNMNAAFAGVANPNGTWTLRLTDGCAADTGAISAATLTVEGAAGPPSDANADFDGDGKTDYSVARDTSATLAGTSNGVMGAHTIREKLQMQAEKGVLPNDPELGAANSITWFINNSGNGSVTISDFGQAATDFLVPNDYDGDGKDDLAVWRPGAPTVAAFYIFQSSTSTIRTELFGQTGDDPAITGDYDGDNKADVATYRCPALGAGNGQCVFFYRGSLNNPGGNVTYVPWGFGQTFDFFVNPGDFDGDGKYDFCIQRTRPGQSEAGQFVLLRSSDFGVEYIDWGNASDIILPGDYDADGRSDFAVRRSVGGFRHHYILERDGGGTGTSPIVFGITGDVSTPGDYDGDGRTDISIWRPSANPDANFFWVLRSSNSSVSQFEWGLQVDVPVASWNVH